MASVNFEMFSICLKAILEAFTFPIDPGWMMFISAQSLVPSFNHACTLCKRYIMKSSLIMARLLLRHNGHNGMYIYNKLTASPDTGRINLEFKIYKYYDVVIMKVFVVNYYLFKLSSTIDQNFSKNY